MTPAYPIWAHPNCIDDDGGSKFRRTGTPNNPRYTPAGHDQTVTAGTSVASRTLFTGISDPDAGESVKQFCLRGRTVGSGHLTQNGMAQAENPVLAPFSISQFSQ